MTFPLCESLELVRPLLGLGTLVSVSPYQGHLCTLVTGSSWWFHLERQYHLWECREEPNSWTVEGGGEG